MKKPYALFIDKWWKGPLLSGILMGLSFITNNEWFVLAGLAVITVSVVLNFITKGWKKGCLTGTIMLVIVLLTALWLLMQIFPTTGQVHRTYSKRYEKKTAIEKIIGVEIPKFKVIDSDLTSFRPVDFEFNIETAIEFTTLPEDKFFNTLDSICMLPFPQVPHYNPSFFYTFGDVLFRCWTKEGDTYKYGRMGDAGKEFLHSRDAYFYFTIEKGSNTAKIVYGNY